MFRFRCFYFNIFIHVSNMKHLVHVHRSICRQTQLLFDNNNNRCIYVSNAHIKIVSIGIFLTTSQAKTEKSSSAANQDAAPATQVSIYKIISRVHIILWRYVTFNDGALKYCMFIIIKIHEIKKYYKHSSAFALHHTTPTTHQCSPTK